MYVRTHTYNQCNKRNKKERNANAYAMCFLVRDNVARSNNFHFRRNPHALILNLTPGFYFHTFFSSRPRDGNTPNEHIKHSKSQRGTLSRSRMSRGGEATEVKNEKKKKKRKKITELDKTRRTSAIREVAETRQYTLPIAAILRSNNFGFPSRS